MEERVTEPTGERRQARFVIEPEEAEAMMKAASLTTAMELLPALVPEAQKLARPPISNYHVGAVGLGASGRIYLGVNLEFPGVPLHHSVHAEQFLVANAVAAGEAGIRCIAVSSFPCGHCRQFLQEIRGASDVQILVTSDDGGAGAAFRPLSYFLPHPFGPPDLLQKDVPLLLEPHDNKLGPVVQAEEAPAALGNGGAICNGIEVELGERLRAAAEEAARSAHAPYSGCASGFAVADGRGRVYAGSYAESAAYNPSLGPVQAALVAYVAAAGEGGGGGGGWEIMAGALVEGEGAEVSHEGTARILLAAVAPGAHLRVYRFRSPA